MKKFSRSLRKSFHLKRSREEETSGASREDEEQEATTGVDGDALGDGEDDDGGRGKSKSAEGFMGTLRRRLSSRQKGRGKDGDCAAPAARIAWDGAAILPVPAPPNGGHLAHWSPASTLSTGSHGDPVASPVFASPSDASGPRQAGRLAARAPPVAEADGPPCPAAARRRDGLNKNVPTDAAVPFPESMHNRVECGSLLGLELRLPGGLDCNDNPTRPCASPAGTDARGFADEPKADVEDMEEEQSSPSSSAMLQSESDLDERGALRQASDGVAPALALEEYCDVPAGRASAADAPLPLPPAAAAAAEEEERGSRSNVCSDVDNVELMPPAAAAAPSEAAAAVRAPTPRIIAKTLPPSPFGSLAQPRAASGVAAGRTACANGANYLNVGVRHPNLNANLRGDAAPRGMGGCPFGEPCAAPELAPCDGVGGGRTRRLGAGRSPGERCTRLAADAVPLDTGAVPPGACRLYEGASRAAATSLTEELKKLARHGWYWGPVTRQEAEEKLAALPDGAFLVRDSSDERYLLSLSFRSRGRTLHTRIEHSNGRFSFYEQPELEGHASVVQLVESSVRDSEIGAFCYSRSRFPGSATYPVRLTTPVSRFMHVRSLQYLCRFVIRQSTRIDLIRSLPLPNMMKDYLQEKHY